MRHSNDTLGIGILCPKISPSELKESLYLQFIHCCVWCLDLQVLCRDIERDRLLIELAPIDSELTAENALYDEKRV